MQIKLMEVGKLYKNIGKLYKNISYGIHTFDTRAENNGCGTLFNKNNAVHITQKEVVCCVEVWSPKTKEYQYARVLLPSGLLRWFCVRENEWEDFG